MAKKNKNEWCVNVVECGNRAAPGSDMCWKCQGEYPEQPATEQTVIHTDPQKQRFVYRWSKHHQVNKVNHTL